MSRRLQCQRAIGAMLEQSNVTSSTALPELPRLHAELQLAQYALPMTQIRRVDHELRDRVLATRNGSCGFLASARWSGTRYCWKSMTSRAFPLSAISIRIAGWCQGRMAPAARRGTNGRATATAISRLRFTTPRSAQSNTSPR